MPADRFLHPRAGHSDKVTSLKDVEFRVWTQYLLSADDFGVVRASAVKFQSDNDALAELPPKTVQRCVDRLVSIALVDTFEHQNRRYLFQRDWQAWQKVEYPRATNEPRPPDDALERCDDGTRALFAKHPGGQRKHKPPHVHSEDVPNVSQDNPKDSPTTRAGARAKRLRLTANASEEQRQEAPLDVWFVTLHEAYPDFRRSAGPIAEQAFLAVFQRDPRDPAVVFAELMAALENHKQGEQWCAGKVPMLLKWLREGLYTQRHDPKSASAEAPSHGPVVPDAEETRRRYLS